MEVDVESLRDGLAPDLTVQEALDLLFAQEDPVVDTVYIAPPPAAVESDEDSCDEDTGGLADNLNHRQLQAPAEIRLPRRMESADDITIIENLHKTSSSRTWVSGRSQSMFRSSLLPDTRFDGLHHYIKKIEKKRRCVGPNCTGKSSAVRSECMKCNVGLCIECFVAFHTR
ncbi:hypothetical protein M8J75_006812 [Diaphorina citri]|nr:hypothetical protein M8J75_006812 [Diaphorina citri]KAI5714542.1 hypothetical protein M8J77_001388 [Diaphorina citri]KAI5737861.1 hypothetical protein M8J77_000130 [Diaphorina citri]